MLEPKQFLFFFATFMEYLLRLDRRVRLAIVLYISLCVHLAILFLSWTHFGAAHIAHPNRGLVSQHPLTVSLTRALPVVTKSEQSNAPMVTTAANSMGDKLAPFDDGLPLPFDSRYFTVDELDQHPAVIHNIPDNPAELRKYPQGGKVVLRLWIDKTGKVVKVEPISSELSQAFVDSARTGFLNSTFSPGRKLGGAVNSVMDVVLLYAPIH